MAAFLRTGARLCQGLLAARPTATLQQSTRALSLTVQNFAQAPAQKQQAGPSAVDINLRIKEQAKHLPLFAVVHVGGKQYKVTEEDVIVVNKIAADVGEKIKLDKVLLMGSPEFTVMGTPLLDNAGAIVQATVIEQMKTKRIIVFKMKRRKGYKRTRGHRQDVTLLRINRIAVTKDLI